MPQQIPAIGEDVTALMPAVGEAVTALMGGSQDRRSPDQSMLNQMFSRENFVNGLTENAQILGTVLMPWGRVAQTSGRIMSAGVGALKGGASRLPVVGPVAKGAIRGAQQAWRASAPVATQAPMPPTAMSAPAVGAKLKLSANQVAERLRQEYGSAKAGQMLYGPARGGVKAADRQANIKRLAPATSKLPDAARRAIDKELAASSADEAFAYAAKAPNELARTHFGDLLRQALLERMKGR